MADKNQLTLIGRIDSKIKEATTQNGDKYVWMALNIEARANATSTDNNYHQTIHVMCFKPKVIDYLKRVKTHNGSYVVIFGFISAFPYEHKGKTIITNAVNANEIYVVQTRPFPELDK